MSRRMKRGQPAREPQPEIAKAVLDLPMVLPIPPGTEPATGPGWGNTALIKRPGVLERIAWLVFSGYSNRQIAAALNTRPNTIHDLIRSDTFRRHYELRKEAMLARVDEAVKERLCEVMLEAVKLKIDLMRDERTNRFLRNKIASEMIELGFVHGRGGARRPSDVLKAIYGKVIERRGEDGSVVRESVKIVGETTPAEAAGAIDSLGQRPDDAGGGGEAPAPDAGPGGVGGETGPLETETPAGSGGDHGGGGAGGVRGSGAGGSGGNGELAEGDLRGGGG